MNAIKLSNLLTIYDFKCVGGWLARINQEKIFIIKLYLVEARNINNAKSFILIH